MLTVVIAPLRWIKCNDAVRFIIDSRYTIHDLIKITVDHLMPKKPDI